jgi:radical SAM protein with 4Fe4S-binding SPASM domain
MKEIVTVSEPLASLLSKQKVKDGQTYRPMNFVVEQPVAEGLLLYHTLTKSMLLLSPEEAELYRSRPETLPQLIGKWFLVPTAHDDRLLSRQVRDVVRLTKEEKKGITAYTILTTTDCNARCFYCYEKGRPRRPMSNDTALRTAQYIIDHCEKQKVSVSWFGGVPLFNKPVITTICHQLSKVGIEFSSSMVSNGYLFNDDTVKEAIDSWRLKKVKISLDGTESVYNRSKAYIHKGVNAYQRVIGNIHRLLDAGVRVSIRLNIDVHNADNLKELADELHREFGSNDRLTVYLHMLFEMSDGSVAIKNEEERKTVFEKMKEIEARLADYGLYEIKPLSGNIKVSRCMADNDHSVVIEPSGNIGKCEHYSEDHYIGHIDSDERDEAMVERFRECHDEIEACATCFDYPNCIWLKLCEDHAYCYPEMRDDRLNKIRQSMLKTYEHHTKEKTEEKNIDILPLADHYVVVTRNKESGKFKESFTLNETGADMLKLFLEGKGFTAVAQAIAEMYGAPLEEVKDDVTAFAETLREKGLVS